MGTEPAAIRYKAFISYSHKDEKAAAWLHRALERYRVPKPLVGKPGPVGPIERRLYPVFRDRDEFGSSADLTTAVRVALERSDFQVVVCSPSAARSRWVNEEILAFKRMGRAERVIALIVDGEPNAESAGADPALECFPPALRLKLDADGALTDERVEPLAADLRAGRDGRRGALLKIISGLLGVRLDALKQRDAAQRRKRLVASLAAFFLAVVLPVAGVVGGAIYLYSMNHREHANALAFDGTVPKLVGSLGDRMAARRASAIHANRIGRWGQIAAVGELTAGGRPGVCGLQPLPAMFPPFAVFPVWLGPTPYALGLRAGSQPCEIAFTYDSADFGPVVVGLDVDNQFLQPVASVDLSRQTGSLSVQGGARGLPALGQYGLELQRDKTNRITSVRFTNQNGAPFRVSGEATRIDYDYDASGLVSSVAFFNEFGRPAASGLMGRARFKFVFDGRGRLTEIAGFDPDGVSRWTRGRDDPPRRTLAYDDAGDLQSIAFAGPDGERDADAHGVAEVRIETTNGLITAVSYLDIKGKPVRSSAILCVRETQGYDGQWHPSEVHCFDADGKAALDERGVHGQRARRDAKGRLIEWDDLDANGDLVAEPATGVARTDYAYNDAGQTTVIANFGAKGEPVLMKGNGFARLESEWDDHGRLTHEKRFGIDQQLRVDPTVGYAELQLGYDETGAENKRCFLDAVGHFMVSAKEGFACIWTTKTVEGNAVKQTTWTEDAERKPFVVPRYGSAKVEKLLAQNGGLLQIRYLDARDQLMEIGDGQEVAGQRNVFDDRGRFTGVDYFGADGMGKVDHLCGYASLIIDYTDDNWISVMQFQDEFGQPANAILSGVATVRLATKNPPHYVAVDAARQPVRWGGAGSLIGDLESGRINATIQGYLTSRAACPF